MQVFIFHLLLCYYFLERIPSLSAMEFDQVTETSAHTQWAISDELNVARIAYFSLSYGTNTDDMQEINITG